MNAPRLLRAFALAIAVLAAIDPGWVRMRRDRPLVSVVAGATAADSARAIAVAGALADRATVTAGWLPAADAVVLTGDRLPNAFRHDAPFASVFTLLPSSATPDVRWREVRAPSRARVSERIAIEAYMGYVAVTGDSLELVVRQDGLLLARETVAVQAGRAVQHHTLSVLASDTGSIAFDVSATLTRSNVRTIGSVLVDVHDTPVRVLSHETRPTWFGTFMRRALSADARFNVTSRTTISRTDGSPITVSEGAPPALASLPDPPALDVVVVGAANAMEDRAVDALDRWVRAGGSALLLLDDAPSLRVQRWLDVPGWRRVDQAVAQRATFTAAFGETTAPVTDSATSAAPLLGRQWLIPTRVPAGSERWLQLADSSPVVWSHRIGAGTVIVSGALDAWTFREPARSDFARTWPRIVTEAAARIAPVASITVRPAVAVSGAWREVEVLTRDAAHDTIAATYTLALAAPDSLDATRPLQLHPRGDGRWGAAWRDPSDRIGAQQLVLSSSGQRLTSAPLYTVASTAETNAPHPSVLSALALATGGRVLDTDNLETLGDALDVALAPASRPQPWHPMRSPWWLLPFAGLLLGEWWLRRRAGRP